MARRRPTGRSIKLHRSYTVDEAARALNVAKGTVRRWIKVGLPALTDQKPSLILGPDLVDFLDRQVRPKQSCRLHECYCFSCRQPRGPAFNAVEFFPITSTSGNLRALCDTCANIMHKRVSTTKLAALRALVEVAIKQAIKHIDDNTDPSVNDHLECKERSVA